VSWASTSSRTDRPSPIRLKINAPSFKNLQVVPHILPGGLLADVVATLGSLDPVLGDVDR
jgi:NADH:ubiquinone oxidoreductase subunit D